MSTPGSPAVIQPASARPIPPPPPNPLSDNPAATQNPRTPGSGPNNGFASGVIASGWQTSRIASASARNGKRRIAPAISGANRSQSGGSDCAACSHGHAVLPARPRVQLVATEHHPAVLALAVDEVVRVAEAGHLARQLGSRDRLQGDVLVVDRRRGDERADHRRDLRRPHPGGVHDELGGDRAGVGQDGRDLAPGRQLEPGHADARPHPHAERPGRVRDRVRGPVRVEVAVRGQVDRAVQRVGRDRGHQPACLVGADHLDVEPDAARPAGGPFQLEQLLAARGEAQAADRLEGTEAPVQLDAVAPEGHHRRRRVERRDEAGRLAGRAGRQLRLLDEEDVGPAGERQVVGDAAAGDPATDDDDTCLLRAHGRRRYLSGTGRFPSPRQRRTSR